NNNSDSHLYSSRFRNPKTNGIASEKLLALVTRRRLRREAGASYHKFGENAKKTGPISSGRTAQFTGNCFNTAHEKSLRAPGVFARPGVGLFSPQRTTNT